MKKLYNCNATCDERSLVSYKTRIVWRDNACGFVGLWYYPSVTSKYHIRKYIQYLREHKQDEYASIVQRLYNYCRDNNVTYAMFDNSEVAQDVFKLDIESYRTYARLFAGYDTIVSEN